jgi:hypothetical protein
MELITTEQAHEAIKGQIHVGSDEQYIALLKSQNVELGDLVRKLRAEKDNLLSALTASTTYTDEMNAKIKSAAWHMRLYRIFSCVGSDSYDPECAELNLDKVMEILG